MEHINVENSAYNARDHMQQKTKTSVRNRKIYISYNKT